MSRPLLQTHRIQRRAGFTLIEVLVVIAIISVLMALVASGVFQYVATQKQANTETLIRTLDKFLTKHWEAVVSDAKKEVPSAAVQGLATINGVVDMRLAQVIWIKMRLTEAFPVSFAEIWSQPLYNLPTPANPFIPLSQQKNLATYKKALMAVALERNPMGPVLWHTSLPQGQPAGMAEPIACLLLALQQSRSGVSLSLDSIAYAVADSNPDQYKVKMAVDGWGNPLALFRFPCGNVELDALNPAGPRPVNPKTPHSTASIFRDPLDPEGLLQQPAWNPTASYAGKPSVYWVEQLTLSQSHGGVGLPSGLGLPPPTFQFPAIPPSGPYTPGSFFTVPVIASPGPNGAFNLDAFMGVFDPITPTNIHLGDDDIYSFRLRLGAKGD